MKRVVWQPEAVADFKVQLAYIADSSSQGAVLDKERIEEAVTRLGATPVGRPGRIFGTYEFYVAKTSHIVVYALEPDALKVLRIIHTSRDWREGEWPDV
jgi:toxin ParE1/3/4